MVDHVSGIPGSTGQMMIRDTGSSVEFWIISGNSSSWDGQLGWSGTVNGVGVGGTFNYGLPGATWRQIGAWSVTSSQNVTFNKTTNSGSTGLGGSHSMTVYVGRGGVPLPPTKVSHSNITTTGARCTFVGIGDGGSPMIEWQIAMGPDTTNPQGAANSAYSTGLTGTRDFSGLKPGTWYGTWARGRNAFGWGSYGPGTSFKTTSIAPEAPGKVTFTTIAATTVTATIPNIAEDGGEPVLEWQLAFGTNGSGPTASGNTTYSLGTGRSKGMTGLKPGTAYAAWGRARNKIGWGGWSPFANFTTLAVVPAAPSNVIFSEIAHESVKATFSAGDNGGSAILEYQIAFGTNGGGATATGNTTYGNSLNTTRVFTGLKPGQYYAAWVRARNAVGWGPWSVGVPFYTLAGCMVRVSGVWKPAVPYVRVNGVWRPAVPYVRVAGVWKGTTA